MVDVNKDTPSVVLRLEELNFFRYVAPEKLDLVRQAVARELTGSVRTGARSKWTGLMTIRSDDGDLGSYQLLMDIPGSRSLYEDVPVTIDKRCYHADAEAIAEQGAAGIVKQLKPLLAANNVIVESTDEVKEGTKHILIWNGERHEIFDESSGLESWAAASSGLLNLINSRLSQAGSQERCYFRNPGGNDQDLVVLTDELYNYIQSLDIHKDYKNFSKVESTSV